jgi:hypothetical protein
MADSSGRGPAKPLYRVDGQLTDQKPPKAEGRAIRHVGGPDASGRRLVTMGPPRSRPAFPRRPLDPACLEPSDLPADQRAEVVRLVRLVQTSFDPEDSRGWDCVADLVRGDGRPWEEVRQMDYHQLAAFFRNRHGRLRIQLGGAVETNTPSIVSAEMSTPPPPPAPAGQHIVLVRADLTRRLQDDWATPDGKRFLLGSTVRDIAKHYGLETHSSLYSNDYWNTVIKPAKKTTGLRAKAIDWMDSLSRDRR